MGELTDRYVESWTCKRDGCGKKLQERETWVHVSWMAWGDAHETDKDGEVVRVEMKDGGVVLRFCDSRCLAEWLNKQEVKQKVDQNG